MTRRPRRLDADATLALVRAVMPTLDGPQVAATIRMHANMHAPPGCVVDDVRGALAALVDEDLVEKAQIDPDPVTALSLPPGHKLGAFVWKGMLP